MYCYKKQIKIPYDELITKLKEELKKEGFGVLTEINVKATLKEKLGVDFDKYVILGSCNPAYAYRALQIEQDIGLMLPCNVIVYEKDGQAFVSTILPSVTMDMIENEKLKVIAGEIEKKLKNVIDNI